MVNFVAKNLKKAGIFNAVLIIAALIFCVIKFFKPCSAPIRYVQDAVYILAGIAGLGYIVGGFKKDAAKIYKAFMFLTCLEFILLLVYDLITTVRDGHTSSISGVLETINCVNLFLLTFAKDLGKNTSVGLGCATFVVTLINSTRLLILYSDIFVVMARAVMSLAIACVVCSFVLLKYADKAARGAK